MALASAAAPDGQAPTSPSNGLALNLSSNNPFRNRVSTASPTSSASAEPQSPPLPIMSKNPFLDPNEKPATNSAANGSTSDMADEIFKDLSISDKKPALSIGPLPPRGHPIRAGTMPLQPRPLGPDDRRDKPRGPLRDGISPRKRAEHRRRASETSVMETERKDRGDKENGDQAPRTESEERRRRERRREREERHKAEKERIRNGGKPRKPQRHLDIIDKLDLTGIYGQGLFHHDGPFDACNPHRNAKKDRRAPMQAFPEGSMNMSLGGAGPLNNRLNLAQFHGRTEEGFNDYSTARSSRPNPSMGADRAGPMRFENPTDRMEQVHGEETSGLGTSTFLEGAPASKKALQRRESEAQSTIQEEQMSLGLQRKKSLAQRLRGMSATRPRPYQGEMRSPESQYNQDFDVPSEGRPPTQGKAVSAGGPSRAVQTVENEVNVFDNEYDKAFEKKGTQIKIAEQEKPNIGRTREPTSPKAPGLTRSLTADAAVASSSEDKSGGSGFLTRMKSLKGGKRPRPEGRKVELQD